MRLTLFSLIFLGLTAVFTAAKADIVIHPLRHVLDSQSREAIVTISNPTGRIVDGRASWIDLTATETGYRDAENSERQRGSAAPWLTLSPAQFRLEPGGRVHIVIRLQENRKLPPGERRSHLFIETGAARTLLRKASSKGLQADISAGVSIPILLRGSGKADAKIIDTRLLRDSEGMLLVSTHIEPDGKHSSFGRLLANFQPDDDRTAERTLAVRENVAGYLDAEKRKVELPLGFFALGKGTLTLRYEGAAEYEGQVFDERRFEITPPAK